MIPMTSSTIDNVLFNSLWPPLHSTETSCQDHMWPSCSLIQQSFAIHILFHVLDAASYILSFLLSVLSPSLSSSCLSFLPFLLSFFLQGLLTLPLNIRDFQSLILDGCPLSCSCQNFGSPYMGVTCIPVTLNIICIIVLNSILINLDLVSPPSSGSLS